MPSGVKYTSRSLPLSNLSNSGGLNSTASPLQLQDNEASDLQNIDFDRFGAFLKRNGYTALNTSAFNSGAVWTSLHFLELSSGTDYLIGTCGNKVAKMDSFDGTWDDITGAVTITAGAANKFKWATFLDTALGVNNVDVPIKWTGSGDAAAMTVPANLDTAKFIKVFNSYTILANVSVSSGRHNSRVYWSALNSISSWDAADFNDVSRNDGQDITGLEVLGDRLVIFKERSIWVALFTGDADIPFSFIKTQSNVGAISGYAISEVDNGLVFLAQDGIYFFDGANSTKISDRISTTLLGFSKSRYADVVATYQQEKNRYLAAFSASGSSTNNRTITWDSYNNAFSYYRGLSMNAVVTLKTSGEERVYFGDYLGYVYRADTGADDYPANTQTAIDSYYWTKWFNDQDLLDVKGMPHLVVYYDYNSALLSFSYSYDLIGGDQFSQTLDMTAPGGAWDIGTWDMSDWGASGGNLQRLDLTGLGRLVRFKFSNATIGQTFKVNGFGREAYLAKVK